MRTRLAFVSDRTGLPQVTAVDGSAPVQITKGDDPVDPVTDEELRRGLEVSWKNHRRD